MAARLFKPFVIRKLIERGDAVKTVKRSAKSWLTAVILCYGILENVLKGHPCCSTVLYGCTAWVFEPSASPPGRRKAIQLHPLVCTGFNADFDGDQMAVRTPEQRGMP
ncbi:MAG: hypothetical protein R3B47_01985 [Bacteroidia bacterium]